MQTETDVEWSVTREGEVSLVSVVLRSGRARQVRVRPTVEGSVWPPRKRGVPAAGWNDGEFVGVVEGRRAVGFATPAALVDSPVEVRWSGPADPEPAFERHPDVPPVEATAGGVLRTLGDPRPPRDAVPDGVGAGPEGRAPTADTLAAVENRVELGEALDAADTLPAATGAVERAGGLDAVRALPAELDRDAERLVGGGERARALRERIGRVTVPVDTLERIA